MTAKKNTYVVGLTGGIGSGKTVAGEWFKQQGIPVIDADEVSREVVRPPSPLLDQIATEFGNEIIAIDGNLDRRKLRDIVFSDEEKRIKLESLLHPAIISSIKSQIEASQAPYTILMSPLLLETSLSQLVHRTLLIDVPEHLQIERATIRDQQPAVHIEKIINAQMPAEQRRSKANDIVLNEGSIEALHQQLQPLHHTYLKRASYLK